MINIPISTGHDQAGVLGDLNGPAVCVAPIDPLSPDDTVRREAAGRKIDADGCQAFGAVLLIELAHDGTLKAWERIGAAGMLAASDGYREAGVAVLIGLAEDSTAGGHPRGLAAKAVCEVDGGRDTGAVLLVRLAEDGALDTYGRCRPPGRSAGWTGTGTRPFVS
ncbi:hypothetical protein [Kitasatospora paranensis]|uniref:Uncharacterized protein n=1 Tax=Kitasatospora paranensis TaxID=258053 RepID=A0ABW2G6T6_9ACTN